MSRRRQAIFLLLILGFIARPAYAGMPSPLELTDIARMRFETISFFIFVLLLSTALIRWLWNNLQGSFPRLPHLSYARALLLVLLWGFLFAIVLTMISGARELMTPGAWEKHGVTYRLKEGRT